MESDIEHSLDGLGNHVFTAKNKYAQTSWHISKEAFVHVTNEDLVQLMKFLRHKLFTYTKALMIEKDPSWMETIKNLPDSKNDLEWAKGFIEEQNKFPAPDVASLARKLPGMDEETVCPVKTCTQHHSKRKLYKLIQHINDVHEWTRDAIADWLEEQDFDLRFKKEVTQ